MQLTFVRVRGTQRNYKPTHREDYLANFPPQLGKNIDQILDPNDASFSLAQVCRVCAAIIAPI